MIEQLRAVLVSLALPYEIVMVDDGSSDGSLEVMLRLREGDPCIRIVSFSRNFGHMAALTAGLDVACGEAVITMDADLQHPPSLIPELVAKWKAGAAVVGTVRRRTERERWMKRASSSLFYAVFRRLSPVEMPENAADFRLLDRAVVDVLRRLRERSRFLRGLVAWAGFRQETVTYDASARVAGETKYSTRKMLWLALDGITAFSAAPLRWAIGFGFGVSVLSFIYILYAVCVRLFTDNAVAGWTSVLGAVLFIGGIQLIFLGVIGEYLGRVFEETKGRPLYVVARRVGFEDSP